MESKNLDNDVVNEPDNVALMCEAVNCFAEATNNIEVKAGNHRTISLSLQYLCE